MTRPVTIYALCHPTTHEVRYVGKSVAPSRRHYNHCRVVRKSHCSMWVQSLGLAPIMVELEVVGSEWVEAEQWWIAYMRSLGANLTNLTAGGEGSHGYKPTAATRAKQSASLQGNCKGKIVTTETKAKQSAAAKVRATKPHAPETKAKIGAAHKGKHIPEEMRAHLSAVLKGRGKGVPISAEVKAKRAAGTGTHGVGRVYSEETRAKMSASAKRRWI